MPLFKIEGDMDAAVTHWAGLTQADYEQAAVAAADDVAWDLVAEIEAQAHQTPNERWHHVAGYFEPMPGGLGAVWVDPGHPEAREAFDLEYGAEDRQPLPVVRSSVSRTERDHGEQWAAGFHRRVFGA